MDSIHILLPLATGVLFYFTGYYMEKKPPKDSSAIYGYKTPASMKSKKHWVFAQTFAATKIKSAAVLMMLCAIPMYFFDQGDTTNIIVSVVLVLLITFIPIFQTESAIAEKFGNH